MDTFLELVSIILSSPLDSTVHPQQNLQEAATRMGLQSSPPC